MKKALLLGEALFFSFLFLLLVFVSAQTPAQTTEATATTPIQIQAFIAGTLAAGAGNVPEIIDAIKNYPNAVVVPGAGKTWNGFKITQKSVSVSVDYKEAASGSASARIAVSFSSELEFEKDGRKLVCERSALNSRGEPGFSTTCSLDGKEVLKASIIGIAPFSFNDNFENPQFTVGSAQSYLLLEEISSKGCDSITSCLAKIDKKLLDDVFSKKKSGLVAPVVITDNTDSAVFAESLEKELESRGIENATSDEVEEDVKPAVSVIVEKSAAPPARPQLIYDSSTQKIAEAAKKIQPGITIKQEALNSQIPAIKVVPPSDAANAERFSKTVATAISQTRSAVLEPTDLSAEETAELKKLNSLDGRVSFGSAWRIAELCGKKYGVPTIIPYAQGYAESGFRTGEYGDAGESLGVSQISNEDFGQRCVNKDSFIRSLGGTVYSPAANVCCYAKLLKASSPASWPDKLSKYNRNGNPWQQECSTYKPHGVTYKITYIGFIAKQASESDVKNLVLASGTIDVRREFLKTIGLESLTEEQLKGTC